MNRQCLGKTYLPTEKQKNKNSDPQVDLLGEKHTSMTLMQRELDLIQNIQRVLVDWLIRTPAAGAAADYDTANCSTRTANLRCTGSEKVQSVHAWGIRLARQFFCVRLNPNFCHILRHKDRWLGGSWHGEIIKAEAFCLMCRNYDRRIKRATTADRQVTVTIPHDVPACHLASGSDGSGGGQNRMLRWAFWEPLKSRRTTPAATAEPKRVGANIELVNYPEEELTVSNTPAISASLPSRHWVYVGLFKKNCTIGEFLVSEGLSSILHAPLWKFTRSIGCFFSPCARQDHNNPSLHNRGVLLWVQHVLTYSVASNLLVLCFLWKVNKIFL